MTNYVIWTRGLRGPAIAVLHGSDYLVEYDRRAVILWGPTPIEEGQEKLPLMELARLYPAPVDKENEKS